jgi:hypothetical protein
MFAKVLPNHSLNRTHCGVRPKARHFILGFSPPAATGRLAQTLAITNTEFEDEHNTETEAC